MSCSAAKAHGSAPGPLNPVGQPMRAADSLVGELPPRGGGLAHRNTMCYRVCATMDARKAASPILTDLNATSYIEHGARKSCRALLERQRGSQMALLSCRRRQRRGPCAAPDYASVRSVSS